MCVGNTVLIGIRSEIIECVVDMPYDWKRVEIIPEFILQYIYSPPCLESSLMILGGMRTLVIKDKNEKWEHLFVYCRRECNVWSLGRNIIFYNLFSELQKTERMQVAVLGGSAGSSRNTFSIAK